MYWETGGVNNTENVYVSIVHAYLYMVLTPDVIRAGRAPRAAGHTSNAGMLVLQVGKYIM